MYTKKVVITKYDCHGRVIYERITRYKDKEAYISSLKKEARKKRLEELYKYDSSMPHTSMADIMDAYEEYIEVLKF